jgi:hypothetical protein
MVWPWSILPHRTIRHTADALERITFTLAGGTVTQFGHNQS